jgi:energy-converting hydrogenase Eha subunit G
MGVGSIVEVYGSSRVLEWSGRLGIEGLGWMYWLVFGLLL